MRSRATIPIDALMASLGGMPGGPSTNALRSSLGLPPLPTGTGGGAQGGVGGASRGGAGGAAALPPQPPPDAFPSVFAPPTAGGLGAASLMMGQFRAPPSGAAEAQHAHQGVGRGGGQTGAMFRRLMADGGVGLARGQAAPAAAPVAGVNGDDIQFDTREDGLPDALSPFCNPMP